MNINEDNAYIHDDVNENDCSDVLARTNQKPPKDEKIAELIRKLNGDIITNYQERGMNLLLTDFGDEEKNMEYLRSFNKPFDVDKVYQNLLKWQKVRQQNKY